MNAADYPTSNRRHFLKHMAGLSAMAAPGFQFVQQLARCRAQAQKRRQEHHHIVDERRP